MAKMLSLLALMAMSQAVFSRPHAHELIHAKRATVTHWVTVYTPEVIIYVDGSNVPFKTEYGSTPQATTTLTPGQALPTATAVVPSQLANPFPSALPVPEPMPVPASKPSPGPVLLSKPMPNAGLFQSLNRMSESSQVSSSVSDQMPGLAIAPTSASSTNLAAQVFPEDSKYASSAASVRRSSNYGISWTPFNGDEGSTTCKPQDQSNSEFAKIYALQFTSVRIYGTDCNQIELAMRAANTAGMKLMIGIFDMKNTLLEIQKLIQQVKASGVAWNIVHTITIGNEDVEKGQATPADVVKAIAIARKELNSTGFQGAIVHVDTMGAIYKHPELCSEKAGDYIAANIHPFFSPGTPAMLAGQFVASQVELLRQCSQSQNKKRSEHRVVVTETGWPTDGIANGQAIPGRSQQFVAIASIKKELPNDVYLYSAFNNKWLVNNAGTFNAEHYWGILDG